MTYLQDKGEADLLPTTIDSYTRQNRYEEAENGIVESAKSQEVDAQRLPGRQPRGGRLPPDHRERSTSRCRSATAPPTPACSPRSAYAGGFTSYEGGGISYNIPYAKNVPLERTIPDWQYATG